ncbi:MAG: autotransporter domain-containing protein [Henriciella sp.]
MSFPPCLRTVQPVLSWPMLRGPRCQGSFGGHDRLPGAGGMEQFYVDVFLQESARLSTGNEADIVVQAREQSRGYVTLGAQLDRQMMEGIGLQARAAGTQYFGDTETAFVSHFVGAPAGAQGFRTLGDKVEQQVELEASLAFDLPMQFHLTAGGFAELGDLEAQGAKIALTKAF